MSARGSGSGSGAGKLVYAFIGARGKIVCEYIADPIQAPAGISKSGLQVRAMLSRLSYGALPYGYNSNIDVVLISQLRTS